ncbi:hypothetical protein JRI60_02865 [Archangium violaceum]|uniref:hypothetical protein n=1 Tax=Archangium violaceum TaxID=83451 RepID=UPI00194F71B7|nr:hypothetical protein [Archangium violaceum]QRN98033.1 hypothetical protein JRI60_02865 [Archangium violaceum]
MRVPRLVPSLCCALSLFQALPASAAPPTPGGTPPAGLIEANAEALCFFMEEIAAQPKQADCEEKAARELSALYPSLPPEQRAQLHQLQAQWPTLRQQWLALDETQKDAIRNQWATMAQEQQSQQGVGGSGPSPTP